MKNITDYLNNINESKYEIDSCKAKGNMKFGYMMYDDMRGLVEIIQFNKLSEYCNFNGFDEEDMMDIDKLEIGKTAYDGVSCIYTRIW